MYKLNPDRPMAPVHVWADRDGGDVGGAVVRVVVRPVDGVVTQPLDVVLKVAQNSTLERHRAARVHRLIARAAPDDRRVR